MMIKFYCFGESGNVYKVVLVLELLGFKWELVYVDFFGGEVCFEDYLINVNEMGEVLVFVDGDVKFM